MRNLACRYMAVLTSTTNHQGSFRMGSETGKGKERANGDKAMCGVFSDSVAIQKEKFIWGVKVVKIISCWVEN